MPSLHRFTDTLTLDALAQVLSTPPDRLESEGAAVALEEITITGIDAVAVGASFQEAGALARSLPRATTRDRGKIDAEVVELIHTPLRALSRQSASDPRFWTWLACSPGRDFSWMRWTDADETPTDKADVHSYVFAEKSELDRRFRLGVQSLGNVSRHAIARLWWLVDAVDGDYAAAKKILANQDVFQSIFEVEVGFVPGLGHALIDVFDLGGKAKPSGTRFRSEVMPAVSQLATITRIETLSDADLRSLLYSIKEERLSE
jgi:hypothetical protein